jgi:hypothetical protein
MTWAKPTIHYCENNLSGWVHQPANAVSSLFISLAGFYIIARRGHRYSNYLGAIAVILGLASFTYYATDTFAGQLADLGSMFLLASLMVAAGLRSKKPWPILIFGAGVPIILTAVFKTVAGFNIGIPLFAILLVIALYTELRTRTEIKYYFLTFIAFMVGFIFWWLDYKKVWCSPSSAHYINGHAIWHFFNALAIILLDRHYSLRPK